MSNAPRWIPVTERKPHGNDGRILMLIADKRVAIEGFITAGHVDIHGHYWAGVPGNWDSLVGWDVTHWMPRPGLPEEQP